MKEYGNKLKITFLDIIPAGVHVLLGIYEK